MRALSCRAGTYKKITKARRRGEMSSIKTDVISMSRDSLRSTAEIEFARLMSSFFGWSQEQPAMKRGRWEQWKRLWLNLMISFVIDELERDGKNAWRTTIIDLKASAVDHIRLIVSSFLSHFFFLLLLMLTRLFLHTQSFHFDGERWCLVNSKK